MSDRYIVVRMAGKNAIPVCMGYNERQGELPEGMEPTVWEYLGDAKAYQNYWANNYGLNYQVRPLVPKGVDWRQRERDRFESGHYTKLPWHDEEWVARNEKCCDHFPHVGRNDPGLIAYTADEKKALRDVKSVLRPARYLHQYYSTILTEAAIREWAAKYKKLYCPEDLLHFAVTAKEISHVYRRGPQSCMSKDVGTPVHPSEAYAGPDLAVAYVKKQGRIVARALCWPKKQIYSRVYGDQELLSGLLDDEGFEQHWDREGYDHAFVGARLTKIVHNNRFICPYIDGYFRVRVGKKYLTIDPKGKWNCQNQDGYCGTPFHCRKCNQTYDQGKMPHHNVSGTHWCDNCFKAHKDELGQCQYLITHGGRRYQDHWFPKDKLFLMGNGEWWQRDYAFRADCAFQCNDCGLRLPVGMGSKKYATYDRYAGYHAFRKCNDCADRQGELPV